MATKLTGFAETVAFITGQPIGPEDDPAAVLDAWISPAAERVICLHLDRLQLFDITAAVVGPVATLAKAGLVRSYSVSDLLDRLSDLQPGVTDLWAAVEQARLQPETEKAR